MNTIRSFLFSCFLFSCSSQNKCFTSAIRFDEARLYSAVHLVDDDSTICLVVQIGNSGLVILNNTLRDYRVLEIIKGKQHVTHVMTKTDVIQLLSFCDRIIGGRRESFVNNKIRIDGEIAAIAKLRERMILARNAMTALINKPIKQ